MHFDSTANRLYLCISHVSACVRVPWTVPLHSFIRLVFTQLFHVDGKTRKEKERNTNKIYEKERKRLDGNEIFRSKKSLWTDTKIKHTLRTLIQQKKFFLTRNPIYIFCVFSSSCRFRSCRIENSTFFYFYVKGKEKCA